MNRALLVVHAKHQILEDILIQLPKCKDYPEWKQYIIQEHNRFHTVDKLPHEQDAFSEFLLGLNNPTSYKGDYIKEG